MAPGAGFVLFCWLFCGRGSQVESCTCAAHCASDGSEDQLPTGRSPKYPEADGGDVEMAAAVGGGVGVGAGVRLGLGAGVRLGLGAGVVLRTAVAAGMGVWPGVGVPDGLRLAAGVGLLFADPVGVEHSPARMQRWLEGLVCAVVPDVAEGFKSSAAQPSNSSPPTNSRAVVKRRRRRELSRPIIASSHRRYGS